MLNDIVNLIFFKEMFQNTEELAQKGRYEAVCHGPVLMRFAIWHNGES